MISIQLCGGLGNQLFMVCTALALAARTNQSIVFQYVEKYGDGSCTERPSYWGTVFQRLPTTHVLPPLTLLKENGFRYEELHGTNVLLQGYFQSYLYFQDFDVRQWLTFPTYPPRNATSLHFRRGDYKHHPLIHPMQNVDYYSAALRHLKSTHVLFFCEEDDWGDVEPMVLELSNEHNIPFERAPAMSDVEHLALMSSCQAHIIANSTFSWWGAYLNTRKGRVVYPSKWLGGVDTQDMFPPSWHRI